MSYTSLKSALGKAFVKFHRSKKQGVLEQRFLAAVDHNNLTEINSCINAGVNPNCKDSDWNTALHLAAERGDIRLAIKLLTFPNICIDPKTYYGNTPLHLACLGERVRMVRFLLKKGANPNARDRFQKTPLHLAVLCNSTEMVRLLVQSGAEVNVIDSMSNTPLHLAAINKCFFPTVRLLFQYGADPNIDVGNMSLFLDCVLACHTMYMTDIICYILDHGVSVNGTDKIAGRNALHFVGITGYSPLAMELLKRGCDPFKEDFVQKKPIDIAICHDNEEVAFVLEFHMEPPEVSVELEEESDDDERSTTMPT